MVNSRQAPDPTPVQDSVHRIEALPELVNRLTHELGMAQRSLAATRQRVQSATRSLEARTQELTEARAALTLLLATLDATPQAVMAVGHFGRAMHFNAHFMQLWQISPGRVGVLDESALLATQLAQVRDPERFLLRSRHRRLAADETSCDLFEMTDGRWIECRTVPQQVNGRRIGVVTVFHDVTEREKLSRLVDALEMELPREVAEARATAW